MEFYQECYMLQLLRRLPMEFYQECSPCKKKSVRAALVAALALAPSVAEYIVTDTYESAHAFCVAR